MEEISKKHQNNKHKIHIFKTISIIFKIILILFLFCSNNQFYNQKFIDKLKYFFLDINKYKQVIDLGEGGSLELFTNNNKSVEIETKNGTIFKSEILFLVIPGGSYKKLGKPEGFPVAKKFYSLGYSTAILKYSVYPKFYPTNYNQGLRAIELLSSKFPKIILIGFSAGGHLAGILGTTERDKLFNAIAMILCYPVISFVDNVHKDSRKYFLGEENENNEDYQKLYSVEKRVNSNTLPTFIWTIKNDKVVDYENTLFMIKALEKKMLNLNIKYLNKVVMEWLLLMKVQ